MTGKLDINLSSCKDTGNALFVNAAAFAAFIVAIAFTWQNLATYRGNAALLENIGLRIQAREKTRHGGALGKQGKDLKPLERDLELIGEVSARMGFSWISLMSDLEMSVPPGAHLVRIAPEFAAGKAKETGVKVTIQGSGRTISDALSMVEAMNRSKRFTDAFLLSHSGGKDTGSADAVDFTISAGYSTREAI